jgi:hypothetical protein
MHRRISTIRAGSLRTLAGIATLALLAGVGTAVAQDLPRTGAERADWARHTNHEELVEFLFEVQSLTHNMLVRELTKTDEGRTMFLVILGDPPAATPGSAWLSGKPTVLLGQNVHGGELSGREGGLQLIRELALGDLRPLLKKVNVLVIPSVNPDGAAREPRPGRTNSHGYDMNRDYVVLETPEISALVEDVLLEWWPDIHLDPHNGGSRPYNLTYQATLHPAADPDLVGLANGPMFEAVRNHMESQGLLLYWYSGPRQDQETGQWYWQTTDPLLRKQHSYSGFQNMIALLYECPGGALELQARSQREGQAGLLKYVADNADLIRSTVSQARQRTMDRASDEVVIGWQQSQYPGTDQFYVVERDPETRRPTGEPTLVTGVRRTLYVPSETRKRPWAYAFEGRHHEVARLLRRHAIDVERLTEPVTITVETYRVTEVSWAERPYQNHHLADTKVEVFEKEVTLAAGTYVVRTGQNGGTLASYLLEPDTDDSIITWNFMDPFLRAGSARMGPPPDAGGQRPAGQMSRPGSEVPIYRILGPVGIKAVLIP